MKTGKPLYDRAIVLRDREEERIGSLTIPEQHRERPLSGRVVAVGDGRLRADGTFTGMAVKVGDEVLFGKYAGQDIKINGQPFVIMREDEIMMILVDLPDEEQKPAETPEPAATGGLASGVI